MFLGAGSIITAHIHGYISNSDWSDNCCTGMRYRLRVGRSLSRYENQFGCNDMIKLKDSPTITEKIPGSGYPLIPGMTYIIKSRDGGFSSIYDIMLAGDLDSAKRGLIVLGAGILTGTSEIAVAVTQPLIIYPDDYFASMQFHKDPAQPI